MDGILATKDGKPEKFTVEVLAIPGDGGNPTFTVRLTHPKGEFYTRSMPHDKASSIFEGIVSVTQKAINQGLENIEWQDFRDKEPLYDTQREDRADRIRKDKQEEE